MSDSRIAEVLGPKPLVSVEVNGVVIASDGKMVAAHVCAPCDVPQRKHSQAQLASWWGKWSQTEWDEYVPRGKREIGNTQIRSLWNDMDAVYIDEFYYRCFSDEDVRWFWSGNPEEPLIVRKGERLIGAVMSMHMAKRHSPRPQKRLSQWKKPLNAVQDV